MNSKLKIKEAASIIQKGGVVIFPTETVYGLGADALNPAAVARIFQIKKRADNKPLAILVANQSQIEILTACIPCQAKVLIKKFWPGPLTLILPASDRVPAILKGEGNSVGLRMPANQVTLDLIKEAGCPLAATSANTSGCPPPTRVTEIAKEIFKEVDMILDGGETELGVASTVVDLTGSQPRVIRSGPVVLETGFWKNKRN
ncbi:MAG: L-threonylcarbamoyladenylate synthase [bacterium]|nr:L-threonylcarbamoyladenylate synthase [bacterium]